MFYIFLQRPEICDMLCDYGCPVDKADSRGWTPAMVATKEGNLPCLQVLLARGCNLEIQVDL